MTEFETNITNRIEQLIFEGKIKSDCQFKIFNLMIEYLGIQSVKEYAIEREISVQSVYQNKDTFKKFGIKLIFNN